ncbi:hypothetical protein FC99_GL002103 [Levilactobacillus koreensis JCM 16448]|uniref:Uncharacterized protein n=1 Tax=Levilactobacillus koreensis TaxID=637971 RepID=A0AAC8UUY0_9LACO|nr:hypothetical protein [Levilactobacillus koreensis]AKP64194.1 hypothetical protein ABN16_03740 [Levilactobacillus koreensis]KRK91528.1 hypothetical protein FC99_GL002103 [Levilactobacillus koreensis JCM 16448]
MQTNWKKTTITFILGTDADHPVKIVLQNAIADPAAKQVEDFGGYLSGLTGLPFNNAVIATQNAVA